MDAQSREMLENILSKDSNSLHDDEVLFLRARRHVLTQDQRKKFSEALGEFADDQGATEDLTPNQVLEEDKNIKPVREEKTNRDSREDGDGGDPYDPDYKPQKRSK